MGSHDQLELRGWDVEIADAARVKGLAPLAAKTDRIDARVLAELARAGVVESIRGVGGGYRFAGNARRLTLFDIIRHFEDLSPTAAERREPGERTPAGRAIAIVLSEIDEIAQATFKSITIATMLRLIERQEESRSGPRV